MLENLAANLPPERVRMLAEELSYLNVAADRAFPDVWDRAMAATGDSQGMGSPQARSVSQAGRSAAAIVP